MDPFWVSFWASTTLEVLEKGTTSIFKKSPEDQIWEAAREIENSYNEIQAPDLITIIQSDAIKQRVNETEIGDRNLTLEILAEEFSKHPVATFVETNPEEVVGDFLAAIDRRVTAHPELWRERSLQILKSVKNDTRDIRESMVTTENIETVRTSLDELQDQVESQQETKSVEQKPLLFDIQSKLYPWGHGAYIFEGVIENSGTGVARDMWFWFELYVEEDDILGDLDYEVHDTLERSSPPVYSVNELIINEADVLATIPDDVHRSVRPEPPFRIYTDPKRLTEVDSGASRVNAGKEASLSGESRLKIEADGAIQPLKIDMAFKLLLELGFQKAHIWMGLEYLDLHEQPYSLTIQQHTLELYQPQSLARKSHYAEDPFNEWRTCDLDLDDIREGNPQHPSIETGDPPSTG